MELNELLGLNGTASIVTGGGSGIGRACALLLARLGSAVCIVERDPESAADVVERIEALGGLAISVVADARENETAGESVRVARERFGRVDVLVNNVGGMFFAEAKDLSPNAWSAVVKLNLDTTFFFSQAVEPPMRAGGRGPSSISRRSQVFWVVRAERRTAQQRPASST